MPWDNPEMYAHWSPSYFVKDFKTPTLVIHGELDYRVPLDQGLQLFTALQMQKVPSKLLVFPDEGHWVLKPQNSVLWYHTVLDWIGEWLKPNSERSAAWMVALRSPSCGGSPEARLRKALASTTTGTIRLPAGVIEISSELTLAPGAHDLEIAGASGTVLKATDGFHGRAILVVDGAKNIRLHDFSVEGNRDDRARSAEMAPPENYFRMWYPDNGILADRVEGLEISGVHLAHVANFPDSGEPVVEHSHRESCGGGFRLAQRAGAQQPERRDSDRRGLVAFRSARLRVRENRRQRPCGRIRCASRRGWRWSVRRQSLRHHRPRRHPGGRATRVRVEDNTGANIGFPLELVDVEHGGTPVGVDTAGNVGSVVYARNHFEEVNGKCIDLDGFHDGAVRGNQCVNRKPAARLSIRAFRHRDEQHRSGHAVGEYRDFGQYFRRHEIRRLVPDRQRSLGIRKSVSESEYWPAATRARRNSGASTKRMSRRCWSRESTWAVVRSVRRTRAAT